MHYNYARPPPLVYLIQYFSTVYSAYYGYALNPTWIDIAKRICPVKTRWKPLLEITVSKSYIS